MKNKGLKIALVTVISLAVLYLGYIFADEAIEMRKLKKELNSGTKTENLNNLDETKKVIPEFDGKTYDLSGLDEKEVLKTDLNNDGVDDIIKMYTEPKESNDVNNVVEHWTYFVMTDGKENKILTSVKLPINVDVFYGTDKFRIDAKDVNNDGINDICINYMFYGLDSSFQTHLLEYKNKTYKDSEILRRDQVSDVEYSFLDNFVLEAKSKNNLKASYELTAEDKEQYIESEYYTASGKLISKEDNFPPSESHNQYMSFEDVDNDGKYEVVHENSVGASLHSDFDYVCFIKRVYKYQNGNWKLVKLSLIDKKNYGGSYQITYQ